MPILSQISFLISWKHRLNASSFSYSPVKATLWLWKRWRIPLRKAKLYFGPSVWFCLQSSFTYLTLRKMLSDRFGSFSYQIKLTKFYQFLALSWRITLQWGKPKITNTKNPWINQNKRNHRTIVDKSPVKVSFACHRVMLLSSRTVFPVMQWELSNFPAILIG